MKNFEKNSSLAAIGYCLPAQIYNRFENFDIIKFIPLPY